MNNAILAVKKETTHELPELSQPAAKVEWLWIALICMLLVASGAHRYVRDWQFERLSTRSSVPLFSLNEFPKELGSWRMKEGSEETLEPEIAKIAGAKYQVIRTYVDEKSGESALVMIIYGLATKVYGHVPEECYPATGYKLIPPSKDVDIEIPGTAKEARFRMQNFVRYKAGQRDHKEVSHSFRNAGEWGLDMEKNWKLFRYHPGMFKIQVQYSGSINGQPGENEPVNELLGLIAGEIERRGTDKN